MLTNKDETGIGSGRSDSSWIIGFRRRKEKRKKEAICQKALALNIASGTAIWLITASDNITNV